MLSLGDSLVLLVTACMWALYRSEIWEVSLKKVLEPSLFTLLQSAGIVFGMTNTTMFYAVQCVESKSSHPKKWLQFLKWYKNVQHFFISIFNGLFWVIFIKKVFDQSQHIRFWRPKSKVWARSPKLRSLNIEILWNNVVWRIL